MSFEYPAASQGPWPAAPKGIILHGTRGGNPNRRNEFLGTVRWATNNPDGLGWHVTIGDGYYAEHLPITEWGWHAREHSRQYIGVEFVQPTVSDAITDDQVAAFARWYRETVAPAFPHLGRDPLMPAHSEMKSGIADGKTDPYPKGDARNEELRVRLYRAIGGPVTDDELLEQRYQGRAGLLGAKKFKGKLTQPYYTGSVLVCERGVVTTGPDISANVIDDWESYHVEHGTLDRY